MADVWDRSEEEMKKMAYNSDIDADVRIKALVELRDVIDILIDLLGDE